MTQILSHPPQTLTARADKEINSACQRIAPTWPLDQLIAVNPFWEMRSEKYQDVTAQLAMLGNIDHFMPASYYQQLFAQGTISQSALEKAAKQNNVDMDFDQLMEYLTATSPQTPHFHTLAELFDRHRASDKMSWREETTHQISQFCAIHFQQQGSDVEQTRTTQTTDLYQHWLEVTRRDRGLSILMRESGLNRFFDDLPTQVDTLLALAVTELTVHAGFLENYAHGLLLDINGWASWVAYVRFQAALNNQSDANMQALLAIKMAWELVVFWHHKKHKKHRFQRVNKQWQNQQLQLPGLRLAHKEDQIPKWIWQTALELSYQNKLHQKLLTPSQKKPLAEPILQAAFCIDVRSEVMRRSLENQDEGIQTLGFAGFFGLPIYFQPGDTPLSRPQLPGLLKASIKAEQRQIENNNLTSTRRQARWQNWSKSAPASFSMVESAGWWYAFKLLKQSFLSKSTAHPVNELSHHNQWRLSCDDIELSVSDKTNLAKGILQAMGLDEFAPWVLLIGHGSQTTNNLQAAGLDCGACGGQTGEVNVRVLAEILNDKAVRVGLQEQAISIPKTTCFVPALHNTTTDVISCFNRQLDKQVSAWLANATKATQQERMRLIDPSYDYKSSAKRHRALQQRANDWSQVRPEWGLVNNAAFIMAPRSWTRLMNLEGRSFLHDYDHQKDSDYAVLELLLTAPMVVTHWINMQYNASVTDNKKYGSGNKVLHNAVNGNMGIFEGNGGDLRIGLAKQSLHNSQQWMHTPQRLSVYVAAPREAIVSILEKHTDIKHLIDNDWLYLFRWSESKVERFYSNHWHPTGSISQMA